jgi:hypothetical protein
MMLCQCCQGGEAQTLLAFGAKPLFTINLCERCNGILARENDLARRVRLLRQLAKPRKAAP